MTQMLRFRDKSRAAGRRQIRKTVARPGDGNAPAPACRRQPQVLAMHPLFALPRAPLGAAETAVSLCAGPLAF